MALDTSHAGEATPFYPYLAVRVEPDQLALVQYDGTETTELDATAVISAQNVWYTLGASFDGGSVEVYRVNPATGEPLTLLAGTSSVLAGLGGSTYAAGYTAGSDPEFEFAEFQYMANTPLLPARVYRFNDPFGRVFREGMLDGEGNVTSYTTYVYDGWQVIQERDANTGNVAADYVHGPGYIDDVIRTTRSGNVYYHHADAHYSTIALTGATGSVVERYGYDAFGAPTFYDGSGTPILPSAAVNNILYTGRTWDPYLSLYDYRTRMYDPATGRFTGPDSASDPNNLGNPYAYLGNNPWAATDPFGQAPYDPIEDVFPGAEIARPSFRSGHAWLPSASKEGVATSARDVGQTLFLAPPAGVLPGQIGEDLASGLDPSSTLQQSSRALSREVRDQALYGAVGSVLFKGAQAGVIALKNVAKPLANGMWVDNAGELLTGILYPEGRRGEQIVVEEGIEVGRLVGEVHHAISKRVWKALEETDNLRGLYKYKDPRFVAKGAEKASHLGYPEWHRELDKEIAAWLSRNKGVTKEEFEEYLRSQYNTPEMRQRFPRGLYSEASG